MSLTNVNIDWFGKSDIQKGLIDTVIVKDQSRFGRSYIQAGMYVEQFKDAGVKFIAVDDCYDSSRTDYDMMFPMRNVINEYYAREASKKTRSAKNAKAKAGQFIAAKAPFGYKLDLNDRHHLIIDEPAAEVVRRIFTLASQGNGFTRIAKILREEKVLTPIAYFNIHNPDYFKSDYWRQEFDWHCESVRVIINNEVYLGNLVYGKERNRSMKSKRRIKVPKSGMNCSVVNGYGMTETTAEILFTPLTYTKGLIPFGNVNVRIADPDNSEIEYCYDKEGELFLSSNTVMIGYYKNEQETAETIYEKNGVRWIKTHDLATISDEGIIKITGRIKRIHWRKAGDTVVRVYPMRTEEELSKSENVERCTVVGKKDDIVAYRSIAYIILKDESVDTDTVKADLDKLSRDNLPESHIPDEYVFVDEFPLTRAGKVDYRALEKMANNIPNTK